MLKVLVLSDFLTTFFRLCQEDRTKKRADLKCTYTVVSTLVQIFSPPSHSFQVRLHSPLVCVKFLKEQQRKILDPISLGPSWSQG
jgi:hypothetical protein